MNYYYYYYYHLSRNQTWDKKVRLENVADVKYIIILFVCFFSYRDPSCYICINMERKYTKQIQTR